MGMRCFLLAGVGLALAVGCSRDPGAAESGGTAPPGEQGTGPAAAAAPVPSGPCPDGSTRFSVTGLCLADAEALMAPGITPDAIAAAAEGCTWQTRELALPGDEALLYKSLTCGERATELAFRGGADHAMLGYVSSGMSPEVPADYAPVKVFATEGGKADILAKVREGTEDAAEANACTLTVIEPGGLLPAGAIQADVTPAFRAANPGRFGDGAGACGVYGVLADAPRYWLQRGPVSFLFDYGQDLPDVMPGSFTVMKKDEAGAWVKAE
jgi:hypothetical protein